MEWVFLIGLIWIIGSLAGNKLQKKRTGTTYSPPRPAYTPPPPPKINIKRTEIDDITLSHEQQKLFDIIESTREHAFITGKAGTGKSVLLRYLKKYSAKRLVVVAPTGVAALNVGGQTIHSLFRIAPGFVTKDNLTLD